MSAPSLDRYADAFERLVALPPEAREAALLGLPFDEEERALLRRMLAADAQPDDPLARVLGEGAAQLAAPRRERLGPYRLLHELGAGGMGTVFLAERVDSGFAQQVAIKLLRGFPTDDGLRRLRRERQILAGLDHPNIARLIDGGESADGQPWLALEYIDGLPLPAYAARHAPRLRERLALFDAVLDAVGHAHQCLVIHRDIKPANVLVDTAGNVKLLDFGIARLLDLDDSAARDTSTRVYSAGYASPEQRDGRAITTASDIYSLGVLLRELLGDISPDAELAGIVARATDDDPARRYASAGELRDDLDRYRDGRPVRAASLTRTYRLRKFIGRHRLGVALSVLALGALGLFVWQLDHERSRAVVAERAASRDAQRANAALAFLTDAFHAAAPNNALGQTVSVRQLLDKATEKLQDTQLEPVVAAAIQRMLGRLYDSLGDPETALTHFRQGLQTISPEDRPQALEIARDLDQYANVLGIVDRNAEARAAIDEAVRLRQRFAPDDAVAKARSLFSLGVWHRNAGEGSKAIPVFRQALDLSAQGVRLPDELEARISAFLAAELISQGACKEAIVVAGRGLDRLADVAAVASLRLWLLRTRASALRACGQPGEAETVLRELIAVQARIVGEDGMTMLQLQNELSIALKEQGRFREAMALMRDVRLPDGLGPYNRAVLLANQANTFDDAGDYPQALRLIEQARAVLKEADFDPDTDGQRTLARLHARLLGLNGKPAQAIAALEQLRASARRIDGEDSAEYTHVAWQLALALFRDGQVEGVPLLLDEAQRFWTRTLPATHRAFGLLHGVRADLAMRAGQWALAEDEVAAALDVFRSASVPPSDIAAMQIRQAELRVHQGRIEEARALLQQALPVLRDAFERAQIDRQRAERLATTAGL